jgi:hypothetical protein
LKIVLAATPERTVQKTGGRERKLWTWSRRCAASSIIEEASEDP